MSELARALSSKIDLKDGTPNIFLAAYFDDVAELRRARAAGQSLNEVNPITFKTPLHIAAIQGAENFILEAVQDRDLDPWIFDPSMRTAFDYSAMRKDRRAMRAIFGAMHPT